MTPMTPMTLDELTEKVRDLALRMGCPALAHVLTPGHSQKFLDECLAALCQRYTDNRPIAQEARRLQALTYGIVYDPAGNRKKGPAVAREAGQATNIAAPISKAKGGTGRPAAAPPPYDHYPPALSTPVYKKSVTANSPAARPALPAEQIRARVRAAEAVSDRVSAALNGAVTMEGLIAAALAAGVPGTVQEWREKLKTAKNLGLARMRLGNILRAKLKRESGQS